MTQYDGLIQRIHGLTGTRSPVLVALDGRCAAGKTTLANALAGQFGWDVVHMDDFFLRAQQRTPARLATPGGNIDYERFRREVLLPLRGGQVAAYRPFDCAFMALSDQTLTAGTAPVTLVEGAYACHPALWEYYDFRVFLTVEPEEQRRRIIERNGTAQLTVFQSKWIPMEEAYFEAYAIAERCDVRMKLFAFS